MQHVTPVKPFNKTLSSIFVSVSLLAASGTAFANTSSGDAGASSYSYYSTSAATTSSASYYSAPTETVGTQTGQVNLVISERPASQSVTEGGDVSFNIDASMSDGSDIRYQWMLNSKPIAGATDNRLSLEKVTLADRGWYSVKVTSSKGIQNFGAKLTVTTIPAKLTISEEPADMRVTEGENAGFSIAASMSDSSAIRYQWLFNDTAIDGATDNTLSLDNVSPMNTGIYKVRVVSAIGSRTFAARLVVDALPVEMIVSQRPASLSVTEGDDATMYIDARMSDDSAIHYQWLFNNQPIEGATDSMLSINPVSLSDSGAYRVRVSNSQGTEYFDASLAVKALPGELIVTERPNSLRVTEGTEASMHIAARMSDSSEIAYQWLFNGEPIKGATSDTFTINPALVADEGLYQVQVSSTQGIQHFDAVLSVEVVEPTSDMSVIQQPKSIAGREGDQKSLTIQADSSRAMTYQWRKDGVNLEGQTSASLNFAGLSLDDAGKYDVLVSDGIATITSQSADVTVELLLANTIQLNWEMPVEREDGAYLSPEEISGYQIYLEFADAALSESFKVNADKLSLNLNDMPSGSYRFAIATIDADGAEGKASEWINLQVN